MKNTAKLIGVIFLVLFFGAIIHPGKTASLSPGKSNAREAGGGLKAAVETSYGKLPLYFEENTGQADAHVKYLSNSGNLNVFLTSTDAVVVFNKKEPENVRLELIGANTEPEISGLGIFSGKCNYLIGNNPEKWHRNISLYSKVKYKQVYPGIDMLYHGNQSRLEYDFIVSPGADPKLIQINFDGAQSIKLDKSGDLVVRLQNGDIIFNSPVIFQGTAQNKKSIPGHYIVDGNTAGFEIGDYDRSKELIIDPVLIYSTYLGGPDADVSFAIAVDSYGNAYITGSTSADFFPTTPGAFKPAQGSEVFVAEFNILGNNLVYSTLIGGVAGTDVGKGIAVNNSGNAYITGSTTSTDFPTQNPLQPDIGGAGPNAFVTEFDPTGSTLVYSTYLGGSGEDAGSGIAIDTSGNAYVAGYSTSTNLVTTPSCLQPNNAGGEDAFVAKINALGAGFGYLTYLGGASNDRALAICIDSAGFAYVTGFTSDSTFPYTTGAFRTTNAGLTDAFIAKINQAGTGLVYSTYAGGSGDETGTGIAVDKQGNAYITGYTDSSDFSGIGSGSFQQSLSGTTNAFVLKLNSQGNTMVYATYLGGSGSDSGYNIAVDGDGNAYVTGLTQSTDFPLAAPIQTSLGTASGDAFVAMFGPSGTNLVFSTYLGGSTYQAGQGIALDPQFNIYITGETDSTDYPVTGGAYQKTNAGSFDAFISKIITQNPPTPTPTVIISPTITVTYTITVTATETDTVTQTDTSTMTVTQTATITQTADLHETQTEAALETATAQAQATQTEIAQETQTEAAQETATIQAQESATAAVQQTQTEVAQETQTAIAQETQTEVAQETATAQAQETATAAAQATQTAITGLPPETQTAIAQETQTALAQQTPTAQAQETATAAAQETQTAIVQETQTTLVQETQTEAAQETATMQAQETATAAAQATQTAIAGLPPETQTAMAQETQTEIVQETQTEVVQETSTAQTQETQTAQAQATQTALAQETQTAQAQETQTAQVQETQTAQAQEIQTEEAQETQTAIAQATQTAQVQETQTTIAGLPPATQTAIAQETQTAQAQATQTAQLQETQTAEVQATQTTIAGLPPATQTAIAQATQTAIAQETQTAQAQATQTAIAQEIQTAQVQETQTAIAQATQTAHVQATLTAQAQTTETVTISATANITQTNTGTIIPTVTIIIQTITVTVTVIATPTYFSTPPSPSQNQMIIYPDPVNTLANIRYFMTGSGSVSIRIYNEVGSLAVTLDENKQAGEQVSSFNASGIAFGVYYCLVSIKYDSGGTDKSGVMKFLIIH